MKKALSDCGPLTATVHVWSDLQFYVKAKNRRESDMPDIVYGYYTILVLL